VPVDFAGKRGRCPKCKAELIVPAAASIVPPTATAPGSAGGLPQPSGFTGSVNHPAAVATLLPPTASSPTGQNASAEKYLPQPSSLLPPAAIPIPASPLAQPLAARVAPSPPLPALAPPAPISRDTSRADSTDSAQEILNQLTGHIEPVLSPWGYKASILLVAFVMVLLPLAYVALIVGVCDLLYLHAVNDVGMVSVDHRSGRSDVYLFLMYMAPLVAGAGLILFMIKPLFARPQRRDKPRSLTRQGEPLLFAFIDRLCTVVGAPRPNRIDVDCQLNAGAGFRLGWLSMARHDLALTIGLPIVAGLSLEEFAGVLAHEFGHFTQGWGMRLSYIVRTISYWFTRVVYQRDTWDEWLAVWSQRLDIRIGFVLLAVRLGVWVTRKVLWVLMMIGHAVAGLLLRQMEFDADLHETRLAGSATFESTSRRMRILGVATQGAYADLTHWYKEKRLGDDLPRLIVANLEQMPADLVQRIEADVEKSKAGWLDTHPSDSQRIARARAEAAPGLFHSKHPASELFSDFAALSKTVTYDFYKAALGSELKITDLQPLSKLLARQEREKGSGEALLRFFLKEFHSLRPLPFPKCWLTAPVDPQKSVAEIKQARDVMLGLASDYGAAFKKFDELDTTRVKNEQAAAIIRAGLKLKGEKFKEFPTSKDEVEQIRFRISRQSQHLAAQLKPFEDAAVVRLIRDLELLHVPQFAAKLAIPVGFEQHINDLLSIANAIAGNMGSLIEMRDQHAALGALLSQVEKNKKNQHYIHVVLAVAERLQVTIRTVLEFTKHFPYPFPHNRGPISLSQFCVETAPAKNDVAGIMNSASAILDRLPSIQMRVMGQLTSAAETIEKGLGLEPLEQPPAPLGV
jgi:Zn-dependent protease with chaperone function